MEGRMNKYRQQQVSPERAKVWTEKSPKYYYNYDHYNQRKKQHQHLGNAKVPVIYYLCRHRKLDHPHFMEVRLPSSDGGLHLRDVIERLNALRGRGMASMYSWSCKRSYKNGYVWHDLCDDDLILPSHGNEYILKGSELFDGRFRPSPTLSLQNQKALLPEPPSSRSQESSSSWNGSLSLAEYKAYENDGLADASTQTEDKIIENVGILPENGNSNSNHNTNVPFVVSPPPSTPSTSSSSGRTGTLQSLIRADAKKMSVFSRVEEDEYRVQTSTRFKASNVILQLVSCGSISVKDCNFALSPAYDKPKYSPSKFSSPPFFSSSLMVGEKEYFSGSLIESAMAKESLPTSYNEERNAQKLESIEGEEDGKSSGLKCIPRSTKASQSKPSNGESMRSPISEGQRISSSRFGSSRIASNGGSKRSTTETDGVKMGSPSVNDDEDVIRIEERLDSGARVIIQ